MKRKFEEKKDTRIHLIKAPPPRESQKISKKVFFQFEFFTSPDHIFDCFASKKFFF